MTAADGRPLSLSKETGRFSLKPESVSIFDPASFPGHVGKEMPIDSGFGGTFRSITHSAKISGGNSGGPLIDRDGRVVGINVQGAGTGGRVNVDYAFSIHSSELTAMSRVHSFPINIVSSKASSEGAMSPLNLVFIIATGLFAFILFLLVLRKPRTVMVRTWGPLTKMLRPKSSGPAGRSSQVVPMPPSPPPSPGPLAKPMRLRGRDPGGRSYELAFGRDDFERAGGRLMIGRNGDLSQLVLGHDSVSRQHAALMLGPGGIQVEDRNSGNGTRVNDQDIPVGQRSPLLRKGDRLTLGEVVLYFDVIP